MLRHGDNVYDFVYQWKTNHVYALLTGCSGGLGVDGRFIGSGSPVAGTQTGASCPRGVANNHRPTGRKLDGKSTVCAVRRPGRWLPETYARDAIPAIISYPGGQTAPSPEEVDFIPGVIFWAASRVSLAYVRFLESAGHTLVVTSDKDGHESVFERELVDADVVISQPFWPAYPTVERIASAPNLQLAITAGIGSDHVDLQAASERGITVAEVTYSNSISVSEHVVMMILGLVRNTSRHTGGLCVAAGISPTVSSVPTISKGCQLALSLLVALVRPCCGA